MPVKKDTSLEWLRKFSEVCGVTGFEQRIKKLLAERLEGCGEVSADGLGSILFTHKNKGPVVMMAAHMDEIGFMVKHISKEGFLKFVCLGGWWEQVMLGQRVTVHTAKGDIAGVIGSKPPHILSPEERKKMVEKKDMFIDVGAADYQEATEEFGVQPGDFITPYSEFTIMANKNLLLGKAWDNRAGCAIMAQVMENLVQSGHPNTVCAAGTVQEEIGLRGAATSAHILKPDIGIVIDTTVAGGMPGVAEDIAPVKLGAGVGITIYDASLIPNTALRNLAFDLARQNKIPYQVSYSEGGGTDGGRIHMQGGGVPTLALSLPTRYIHSHQSIIHRKDYQAAVQLITALIKHLDSAMVQKIRG